MIQLLRYEIRSQRKRFSIISVMIAIALSCFIIIDAFIQYANDRVAMEAKPLAGADIVVDSTRIRTGNTTNIIRDIVGDKGEISQRITLNTNITSSQDSRLVQLLGVDNIYPLYGTITITPIAGRTFSFGNGIAVDEKTYAMLDNGKITLGDITVDVDGIIADNPGLSLNLFTQGRQVIAPLGLLEQTGLLRLGSRAEYEYLIKVNNTNNTEDLIKTLNDTTELKPQRDVDDYQGRVSQVGELLDELGIYLLLVIFCAFLLVAVTSMLSIDEYLYRRLKTISIMQILGTRKWQLIGFYGVIFVSMVTISSLLAYGISSLITMQLQQVSILSGFSLSNSAIRQGIGVSIILTVVARSLPLLKIILRSPLSGLAESSINLSTRIEKILGASIITIGIAVVLRIIGESLITTVKLGGIIIGVSLCIWLLIRGLFTLGNIIAKKYKPGFILYDAIRSTTRPGNTSVLIASTLIVALSTMLLITQFGGSFISRLTFSNNNQPNWFVVNVPKDELQNLRDAGIQDTAYNIVLGRILSINNTSLSNHLKNTISTNQPGGEGRFTREFNITTVDLPKQDTVAGNADVPVGGVSLDKTFARDLKVGLGDTLTINIAGKSFDLNITGLRNTNRTNFSPFFYIQLNKEQFADAPMTYFLTLRVADDQKTEMRKKISSIVRPGVSFIEIDNIVASIRTIGTRIQEVVEVLLGIILLFACFTTIVCVENMRYAKAFKMRLYRILGATSSETRKSVLYEYAYILGIAVFASIVLGWGTATYFISNSDFLSRSRSSTGLGSVVILGIVLLNGIVIVRTMKQQ